MKFKLIYIDFPWRFNARNNANTKFGHGMSVYQGMSLQDILKTASPINDICDENCVILSWICNAKADEYFLWLEQMKKFRFRHVGKLFSWVKIAKSGQPRALPGHYTLGNTEDLYIAVRGSVEVKKKGVKQVLDGQFDWTEDIVFTDYCQQPHSKKPDSVRDKLVEIFGDVPRLELFARNRYKNQDGWVSAGNEIEPDYLDIFTALELVKNDKYV
jgi:N6-adenosine-specific RNA methylase IME4